METTIEVDIAENKKEDKANSHLPEVLTGNDPVGKALTRFLTLKKLNERRNNELR